jgi:hypothetical protein
MHQIYVIPVKKSLKNPAGSHPITPSILTFSKIPLTNLFLSSKESDLLKE